APGGLRRAPAGAAGRRGRAGSRRGPPAPARCPPMPPAPAGRGRRGGKAPPPAPAARRPAPPRAPPSGPRGKGRRAWRAADRAPAAPASPGAGRSPPCPPKRRGDPREGFAVTPLRPPGAPPPAGPAAPGSSAPSCSARRDAPRLGRPETWSDRRTWAGRRLGALWATVQLIRRLPFLPSDAGLPQDTRKEICTDFLAVRIRYDEPDIFPRHEFMPASRKWALESEPRRRRISSRRLTGPILVMPDEGTR